MKFSEIKNAVKHITKTFKCMECEKKHESDEISIIATTCHEGLFEVTCKECQTSVMITVSRTQPIIRNHRSISENEVLDFKNFLNKFDGNFKKLFIDKK